MSILIAAVEWPEAFMWSAVACAGAFAIWAIAKYVW